MTVDLTDLPNIGPKTAAMLQEVGIDTVEALRSVGAIGAYRRLKFSFPRQVSLNALWALHGALTGVPWTTLEPAEKRRLRAALSPEDGRR